MVSSVVCEPYAVVVPYSTCEVLVSLVVQVMVAVVLVIALVEIPEMVGGVVSGGVFWL